MGLAFDLFWGSKATVTNVQPVYPHVDATSTVSGVGAFAMPLKIISCMDYADNP